MLGEEESEFFGGEGYWGQNSYGEDDANDQGSYMMGYYDEEDDEDVEEEEEYSAQYASYEDDEKSQETPKIISLATGLSDESDEQSADEREQFFKSNEDEEDWANIDLHAHSPLREYLTDHFPDAAFPESDDDEDSISRILRGGHPRERNSGDESDLVNNGSDGSFHYDHNDDGEDDEDDEEIDYQHQRNPLIPQQQRNISKSKKSLNPRKAPPRDRKRGVKNPPKSNGLKEVERKHKMWLLELVERRREEEQQILKKMEKSELRRKKFKEALLEKARQKQLLQQQVPPQQDSEVVVPKKKAAPKSKPPPPPIPAPQVEDEDHEEELEINEENLAKQEDEAKQLIEEAVRMRKKFKKQQKEILESLRLKKEEEERKMKEAAEREELKREKLRRRNEKLLRKKDKTPSVENDHAAGSGVNAVRATRSQGELGVQSLEEHEFGSEGQENIPPPKISKRSRSVQSTDPSERSSSKVMHKEPLQAQAVDNDDNELAIREQKRANMKKQQDKIQSYLSDLAEKKREEADKAKRKEDRARKRAILLAQRVQAETNERKLMAREDKYANPSNVDGLVTKPEQCAVSGENDVVSKKKITSEMAEAIAARLAARQMKNSDPLNQPQARDFNDWKKKNSVPSNSRVFCMTGWYPCVKAALLQRGWYFNPDSTSSYFDMKWTLRSSDISDTLQSWQLTNHFLKNIALTTKVGLLKSLQQLVWLDNTSATEIIPRGYDLSNPQEIQEYLDDFRIQEAECILKRLYYQVTGIERLDAHRIKPSLSPPATASGNHEEVHKSCDEVLLEEGANEYIGPVPSPIVDLNTIMINDAVFSACCSVLSRYQRPFYQDDHLDKELQPDDHYAVSPLEWELIESYDIFKAHTLPETGPEPVDEFLQERKESIELNSSNMTSKQRQAQQQLNRQKRDQRRHDQNMRMKVSQDIKKLRSLTSHDLDTIHQLLCRSSLINGTQSNLNGRGPTANNMWIVKPAAKSRGRGITTFNNLPKLLNYVELGRVGSGGRCVVNTSSHWIVQKYMENSLIIANRKFDLRQWVLVVDWNPLTIYFYDECYCRFSVDEYTTSEDGLENCFVHLVNNSIGKNSENFDRVVVAENNEKIEGYMWSYEHFCKYLQFRTGQDDTDTPKGENQNEAESDVVAKIRRRMKDIAIWALMSGVDHIEHRKNSWELYGFDYMIDDDYTPWLIEINSSPACDYSTKVTERYVQKALVELLNVVLDVREWEAMNKKNRENIPCPNTGGWEKIYQGPFLETPSSSFGTDISIKGETVKLPKRRHEENGPLSPQHAPVIRGYQTKKPEPQTSFPVSQVASQPKNLSGGEERRSKFPTKLQSQVTRDRERDEGKEDMEEEVKDDDDHAEGIIDDSESDEDGNKPKEKRKGRANMAREKINDSEGTGAGAGKKSSVHQQQTLKTKKTESSISSVPIPIKTFSIDF